MKRCIAFILIALLLPAQTHSIKPRFNSYGYLVLDAENDENFTHFIAIVCGVETWYLEWEIKIEQYLRNGPYMDYLPNEHGNITYQYVDNLLLANLIHYHEGLDLHDVPDEIITTISDALYHEYINGDVVRPSQYDPWSDWKWRSEYMEEMYSRNWDITGIRANCWGTADYLAKDYQWADQYENEHPNGAPDTAKFPYIYCNGNIYNLDCEPFEFAIDYDLIYNGVGGERAMFKERGKDIHPKSIINAFDIIRISESPGTYNGYHCDVELRVWSESENNIVNVGRNLHSVVYLCTDAFDQGWIYEKHNKGNTNESPYDLNIFGNDKWNDDIYNPVWMPILYDTCYNSFFKKYGYNKDIQADSYDMNWAGITP